MDLRAAVPSCVALEPSRQRCCLHWRRVRAPLRRAAEHAAGAPAIGRLSTIKPGLRRWCRSANRPSVGKYRTLPRSGRTSRLSHAKRRAKSRQRGRCKMSGCASHRCALRAQAGVAPTLPRLRCGRHTSAQFRCRQSGYARRWLRAGSGAGICRSQRHRVDQPDLEESGHGNSARHPGHVDIRDALLARLPVPYQ